jgi:hypothetical protein
MATTLSWLVAAPVAGLLADTAAHLLLCRCLRPRNLLPPLGVAFLVGLGVVALIDALVLQRGSAGSPDWLGYTLLNCATYAALAFNYWAFVNLNVTSLRIRLLKELVADNAMPMDVLLRKYNAADVVDRRLARLTGWRQLRVVDGQFFGDRPGFLLLARTLDAVRGWVMGAAAFQGGGRQPHLT